MAKTLKSEVLDEIIPRIFYALVFSHQFDDIRTLQLEWSLLWFPLEEK